LEGSNAKIITLTKEETEETLKKNQALVKALEEFDRETAPNT
jgi:hypothetical protein